VRGLFGENAFFSMMAAGAKTLDKDFGAFE
jgi:hypothetical protein